MGVAGGRDRRCLPDHRRRRHDPAHPWEPAVKRIVQVALWAVVVIVAAVCVAGIIWTFTDLRSDLDRSNAERDDLGTTVNALARQVEQLGGDPVVPASPPEPAKAGEMG